MARPLALALSATLALPPSVTLADSPEAAGSGVRVRLTAPELSEEPLVGALTALEPDRVLLHPDGRPDPVTVPRALVTKWEVSRGRKTHVLRNAGWGLLAGAAVGTGLALGTYDSGDELFSQGEAVLILGGFFGGIGAGIGALTGLSKTERWEETETSSLRLVVMPVRGGVGMSVGWSPGAHPPARRRGRTRATRPGTATAGPPLPASLSSRSHGSARSLGERPWTSLDRGGPWAPGHPSGAVAGNGAGSGGQTVAPSAIDHPLQVFGVPRPLHGDP